MNAYLLLAGIIALLGGLAHTILGHQWTVKPMQAEHLASSQNSGEQNVRYLTWFWHIGSAFLLSSAAILLIEGSGVHRFAEDVLWYVSFLWLCTTALFIVIAGREPSQVKGMIPGWVGIPVNILILIGLSLS